MNTSGSGRRKQKSHHPQTETGQEAMYLRALSERQTQVVVQLRDGEALQGWIEYFDDRMIRLTREGRPNLFIYKHQILTITEKARGRAPRKDRPFEAEGPNGDSLA
ncbi:MAG: RNA chaperone Hfq [Acidobacteriaceae bacterium]